MLLQCCFLLDQFSKFLVVKNLAYQESASFGILIINHVRNTGASFSLFSGWTGILALFSICVALAILLFYKKIDVEHRLFFAFILAGTLGNLLDRIRLEYVIDFIDFRFWPVFNVADAFVCVGAVSLLYIIWKE